MVMRAIGVDMGGTKIEACVVDEKGRVLRGGRAQTPVEAGEEAVVKRLVEMIEGFVESGIAIIGVGAAGQIDKAGRITASPNLPFRRYPLRERLEKELALPVLVCNDVQAAAYGEWRFGAGVGARELVALFVGTGIGGAVISRGRLLKGCTGSFGELGHTTLVAFGRRCRCRNLGCLEAYAGGWAIAERAQEAVAREPEKGKALIAIAGGVESITAETVGKAYAQGDGLAKAIVDETGRYLAAGVVGIANAFNPCLLVLGGGVVEGIPELVRYVEEGLRRHALAPNAACLKVVRSELGARAGAIGAAVLALAKAGEP